MFRFDEEHYEYWTQYSIPVLVVLHNPNKNIAYLEIIDENTVTSTGKGWRLTIAREKILAIQTSKSGFHPTSPFARQPEA